MARRRAAHCVTLFPLALAWLLGDFVFVLFPAANTWEAWNAKELIHALLAFALGAELGWRALLVSPLGQLAAARWVLFAAGLGALFLGSAPAGPPSVALVPRALAALAWLYAGLLVVMARYMLPVEPLHRNLMVGLSAYSILYFVTWSHAADDVTMAGRVSATAFALLLAAVAWAVWRPVAPPPVEPEIAHLVWPWTR